MYARPADTATWRSGRSIGLPAVSKAQANLFRAAEHGATFAKAKKLRASMTLKQIAEFARTPSVNLPRRVAK